MQRNRSTRPAVQSIAWAPAHYIRDFGDFVLFLLVLSSSTRYNRLTIRQGQPPRGLSDRLSAPSLKSISYA